MPSTSLGSWLLVHYYEFDYQATLDLIVDDDHNEFHPHETILSLIRKLSHVP